VVGLQCVQQIWGNVTPMWNNLRVPFFSVRDCETDMMSSQLASPDELLIRQGSRAKQSLFQYYAAGFGGRRAAYN
jgi:hypothetical protein